MDESPNAVAGLSALAADGRLHEVDPKLFSREVLMSKDSKNTTLAHLLAREKAVGELPEEMFRPEVLMERDQFDATVFHTLARTGKLDRVPDGMLTPEILMERDRFGTVLDAAALNGHLDQIPPGAWKPEFLAMKPLEPRGDGSTVAEALVNKEPDYVRVSMSAFSEEVRAGLVSAVISEAGSRAYRLSVPLNQTSPAPTAVSLVNELSHRLGTEPTYEAIEAKLNVREWAAEMGARAVATVLTKKRELDALLSADADPRELPPDNALAPRPPLDELGKKGVPFDTAQAAAVSLSEVLQNVQFVVVQSPEDLREALNGTNNARILRLQGLYEERQNGKPGVVWIVADNVIVRKGETPEGAVERVGFHEAAGHHGIRKVLGDRAEATFERVYEWAKTSESAEVRSLFTAVTNSEDYRQLSKAAQAEEILARLQESRQHKDLSFWECSMGAVCQMVGQHLPKMQFSATECEYLLWQARIEAKREPDKQALFKSDMAAQVDFFKLQASKLHISVEPRSTSSASGPRCSGRKTRVFSASGKLFYSMPLTAPRQEEDYRPSEIPDWQAAASKGELFRVIRPGEDLPLSGYQEPGRGRA